jgi:hypothetical protein
MVKLVIDPQNSSDAKMVDLSHRDKSQIPLFVVIVAVSALIAFGIAWNLYTGPHHDGVGPARPTISPVKVAPRPAP